MTYLRQLASPTFARAFFSVAIVCVCACSSPETETPFPDLVFRISGESGLTAARDLTIDRDGNVFIFDYGDYVIRKFDPPGTQLATFGSTGEEPGLFQHLMAIEAQSDSLIATVAYGMGDRFP